jgi:hypothetical protein
MDAAQKASFAQRMKGRLLAMQQGAPKPPANGSTRPSPPPAAAASLDDIPF